MTGQNANLLGFIDWNNDGAFDGTGEVANIVIVADQATAANIIFDVPNDAVLDENLGARFRITTDDLSLLPEASEGAADDGEVEDYLILLSEPVDPSVCPTDLDNLIADRTVTTSTNITLGNNEVVFVQGDVTIPTLGGNATGTLVIESGVVTVQNINVSGLTILVESGATFIKPSSFVVTGRVLNKGLIESGEIVVNGILENCACIQADGAFSINSGGAFNNFIGAELQIAPGQNFTASSGSTANNFSLINVTGGNLNIDSGADVTNSEGGFFNVSDNVTVNGNLVNESTAIVIVGNHFIVNNTATNNGEIYVEGDVFNVSGSVDGTGTVFFADGSGPAVTGSYNNTDAPFTTSPAVPVSACGELPLGTIGNFVYIDEDSDGFQDEGEVGIPNVAVVLKDGNGNPLDTTYTDSDGKYLFTDLPTGNYFVDVLDGEDGTANTLPNAALSQTTIITNEVDSPTDVDTVLDDGDLGNKPHVGNGYAITLDPGEENLTADFGYNYNPSIDVNDPPNGNDPTAALGDRVWIDSDGDGVQDPNEIGVSGVQITLTGAGADGIFGTGDDVIATTTTDENGFYLFDNLTPGAYRTEVTSSDPAVTGVQVSHDVLDDTNYTQTGDPDEFAELATMPDNKQTKSIVLGPGDVFLNSDYGYQPTPANMILGSIGNTIWLDADADANGPEDNDPLSDGDNGAGTENDNEEAPIASVSVSLIQDTNGDGVWDPDGADNMLGTADDEPIVATDVTDENGQYLFEDLPLNNAGDGDDTDSDYIVWVNDTDNVLDGLQNTFDEDGGAGTDATGAGDDASAVGGLSAVTLDNTNRDDRDQDFGYTGEAQTPNDGDDTNDGFIGDFVWFDTDGDDATPDMGNIGQNQAEAEGDAGIEGVMVELNTAIEVIDGRIDVNDDGVVNGDDDGVIDGISIINGRPDLNGDGNTGGLDNGFILGVEVISGRVDIDENGSTSAADRPDDDGFLLESVAMAKTDENGFYFFGGLPVDDDGVDYRVRILDSNFAPGGVLENLESTFEPDGNNDNLGEVVTLTTAMPGDLDQDFGYTGDDAGTLGSIGSTIWEDTDNDGVYEPDGRDGLANTDDDEMPLAGITVDLYRDLDGNGQLDPGEPLIGQATTDAMGNYLFDNLPMGDYIVDVSDEAGLLNGFFSSPVPTTDANTNITGTGDAETADDAMGTVGGDRSKPDAFAVTLDDNNGTPDVVNNLNVDFGYYKEAAALGNYVWLDTNGNGLQDDGETGINGVQVSLEIEYPDGTTVIVVTETVNDANDNPGFYEFPNLLLDEDYNSGAGTGVNGEDPNSVDPTGTQTPKYVIAVDPNQTVFTNQDLSPTLTDVAAATMDKDDADAFTGVVAIPIQGSEDTAAKDPEIDENPIASYDFGVANQLDLATIVEVTSPTPPQGFYDEDDPVTFTSTTTNQGDVAISDLTIINYLPNELENHELVLNSLMINGSMPPAGVTITKNGDDYIIDFGNDPNNWLQPDDVVSFEIISDISPFAVPSTMIINTTEISAYDTDNDPNTPVLDDVDSVADNTNGNGPGETIGADLVDNETGEDGRNGGDEDDHDIAELPMDLVLPVEWLGFSVKAAKEHIDLTWATASEINNSHFELERSEDGKSFKQIARVKGQGNTLTRTDYSYEDKTAISGVLYYYRVKNVDFDESFSYSEIRSARLAAEKADMEVYPNPVGQNQTLNVRIFLEDLSTAIYLMDIDGNRVRVLRENVLAKGWNTIALSVADLAAGTYFVTDQNGNSKQFIKIE
ncbi:MAG: SdrD B-like domain-containing protein [Bacteroidota bacterium]